MTTEQFTNAAASTLTAAITLGAPTLTVASATGFPTTGRFRIRIDSEILTVTSVSGAVFTVSRATEAVNGVTTAAAHGINSVVTEVLTAESVIAAAYENALATLDAVCSYDNNTGIAKAKFRDGTAAITGTDFADVVNQAACKLTAYGLAVPHVKFNGVTAHYAYPTAPTLSLGAVGSVTAGYHFVMVTYTALRDGVAVESHPGIVAGINSPGGERIDITIPTGPTPGTTGRRVYVTKATNAEGGAYEPGAAFWPGVEEMHLLSAITNNTDTTLTFNTADGSLSATVAADSTPTLSDGGSIGIARAEGTQTSPSTRAGATPMVQGIQIYTAQSLYGQGMATRLLAQSAYTTQIGTIAASGQITTTTQTTADVTETVTPPAVPFLTWIQDDASAGGEFFMTTARTLVSGSTYTYTFTTTTSAWGKRRGTTIAGSGYFASRPDLHSTGTKVYACDWGAGRLGAMVDAYNADRVHIQGLVLDGGPSANKFTGGGGIAPVGILQKRNKQSDTGGDASTSRIVFNDVTGCAGCEIMIGRCDDPYATANVWVMDNRAVGGNGCGLGVFLGDGFYRRNNVPSGVPATIMHGSSISVSENHFGAQPVSGSIVDLGCVYIRAAQNISLIGNYIDNIRVRGIYRPAGLSSVQDTYLIADNYFNGSAAGGKWVELDQVRSSQMVNNHGDLSTTGYMLDLTTSNQNFILKGNTGSNAAAAGHSFFNASHLAPAVCEDNVCLTQRSNGHGVSAGIATGGTIAHGLGTTPTVVFVTALDSGPTDVYVTSIGATTFAVNFGGGGSAHVFAWEAFLI